MMIRWPNIGLWGNFSPCEEGVLAAINQNFFILDLLVQMGIENFVASLPADPLEGDAYILTAPDEGGEVNDIMVWDGNSWVEVDPKVGFMGFVKTPNQYYWFNGTNWVILPTNLGDVVGPGSSVDNSVVRFDGVTGKVIQGSGVIIDDSNNITGVQQITSVVSDSGLGKSVITRTDSLEGLLTVNSTASGSAQALAAPLTFATRFTGALVSIASFGAAPTALYGRVQIIINGRASTITLTNGASIVTGTGADLVIKPGAAIWMYYDSTITAWVVIGGSGGGSSGIVVADNTALLAIPTGDRADGTRIYQVDEKLNWQYQGGITNADLVLLNNYHYVYPSAQSLAAAAAVSLTTGIFKSLIKVSSSVSGGSTITLPSGRRNGEELALLGNSAANTPTIQEAANVIQNGDISIQLNQLVEYVWITSLTAWVKKGV